MSSYNSSGTIRDALNIFFEKYNLGEEGGLNQNWAYLDFGLFRMPFPNTSSRKKALIFHDIHHILTGYKSDWRGEAEISAWEISSGCGQYSAAWVLDLGGLAMGLILFPVKTFRAFIRGRRTQNLYLSSYPKEEFMKLTISEGRLKLGLDRIDSSPATKNEILAFIGWGAVSAIWYLPFLLVYGLIAWWCFF